jgi:hypothetical protein
MATDFSKQRLVTGAFYYLALLALLSALFVALYWQVEYDDIMLEFKKYKHVSTPENRNFFVSIHFCSPAITDFKVIRHYKDIDRNIFYSVPDSKYQTSQLGCFDTRLQANTGRLDPGNYEYHVSVSYELNPLRTEQHKVAIVSVTVQ